MPTPEVTPYQVGELVYIPFSEGDPSPKAVVIDATESVVTSDGQTNYYTFVGLSHNFKMPQSKVFSNKAELEDYSDSLIDEV